MADDLLIEMAELVAKKAGLNEQLKAANARLKQLGREVDLPSKGAVVILDDHRGVLVKPGVYGGPASGLVVDVRQP